MRAFLGRILVTVMERSIKVYCYDLVPTRIHTRWTRAHDDVMRAEYFPGLDPMMLLDSLRKVGRIPTNDPKTIGRAIANRLSELGLRNRMTGIQLRKKE